MKLNCFEASFSVLHGSFYSWQHCHWLVFPSDEKSRHEVKRHAHLKPDMLKTQGLGTFSAPFHPNHCWKIWTWLLLWVEEISQATHGFSPGQGFSLMPKSHTALTEAGESHIFLEYCYLFIFILLNPKLSLYYCFLRGKKKCRGMGEEEKERNK